MRLFLTISFLLLNCFLYAQDSNTNYEFGAGIYHSVFKGSDNTVSSSKDRNTLTFSVNRKSNLKNGFSLVMGIHYKNLMLQYYYNSNQTIPLDINDSVLASNGHVNFDLVNAGENWLGVHQAEATYRINYAGDEQDYRNDELMEYHVIAAHTLHTLGAQLGAEKTLGKGKNKFKIEGTLNPFFSFSPTSNITKYRNLGIHIKNQRLGYIFEEQYIERIKQIEKDFNLTKSNIHTFGIDASLAFGLIHNDKYQILLNLRRNLRSISTKEKVYIQSIGLELRYQI